MEKQRLGFSELLIGMEAEFVKRGLTQWTRLYGMSCCKSITDFHESRGYDHLDDGVLADLSESNQTRYDSGEIGKRIYDGLRRNMRLLAEYDSTGTLRWSNPAVGSPIKLLPEFERVASEYYSQSGLMPNTRNDARWVTRKYFAWLAEQGFERVEATGAAELQRFLVFCSKTMKQSSVHDIQLYLKKLCEYLNRVGLYDSPYTDLLSFKVNRGKKVMKAAPKTEIAAMLAAVDRSTKRGKRDYAILLLGTVLGLRAIDIVNIELDDVDWVNGEIRFMQAKTRNGAALPLTEDVATALNDYILKARPKAETRKIFLRMRAPHKPFASAVTVGNIYTDWRVAAGLTPSKSFHSLRRALGRDMITTGADVYTVAQVFCDADVESIKPYLSLDSTNLKLCALSFDGIELEGGDER